MFSYQHLGPPNKASVAMNENSRVAVGTGQSAARSTLFMHLGHQGAALQVLKMRRAGVVIQIALHESSI